MSKKIKDYYAVLSVARDSSQDQIKDRFRQLVRERHPDLFEGKAKARAELEFQDITEAFNILSDPLRRRQHNIELEQSIRRQREPDYLLKTYLNRGIRAYKKENYIEAANNFLKATENSPDSAQAWHHLALTSMQEERWLPKAREAISRACELKPENGSYLKLAGKIYAQSGMTDAAREYYNRALQAGERAPTIRKALQSLDAPLSEREGNTKPEKKSGFFRKAW